MEEQIGDLLVRGGRTLAVAESCTGGMLGARITSVPGSSRYFRGGIIAYANDVKTKRLGVAEDLLESDGAVSPGVARQMARGVRRRLEADFGIGVTGVAGPDGGSAEKPVGLVYIAVDGPGFSRVAEFHFDGGRNEVRLQSCYRALEMLRDGLTTTAKSV